MSDTIDEAAEVAFEAREYAGAFGHLPRLRWTNDDTENYVIPCPRCASERLGVDRVHPFDDSVDVILRCQDCGERSHIGIAQRPSTKRGETLVKLLTD